MFILRDSWKQHSFLQDVRRSLLVFKKPRYFGELKHRGKYFKLLKPIDTKLLSLTPIDQELFEDFRAIFSDTDDIAKLDKTFLHSEESKGL